MPNWVMNSLLIEAEPAVIAQIKAQVSAPFEARHFDWQTNEPKVQMVEQPFAFWNIIKPTDLDAYWDKADTPQTHPDHWYAWNNRNWGVKWDASNCEEIELDEDNKVLWNFDTPWGLAENVLIELSRQYPTAMLELEFEEETGWGGRIVFDNGNATVEEEYENKCRDCSALNTLDYCDDCGNQLCSACKYIGEADQDTLKECEEHKHLLEEVKA
jgi:hypothetical protein